MKLNKFNLLIVYSDQVIISILILIEKRWKVSRNLHNNILNLLLSFKFVKIFTTVKNIGIKNIL